MMKSRWNAKLLILSITVLAGFSLVIAIRRSRTQPSPPQEEPEVEIVQVEQREIPVYGEWDCLLDGVVTAEIKGQVTGYLLRRSYTEGSFVKKGQLLFEIDPRPFQASLDQARVKLTQAEEQLTQANDQLSEANAQAVQDGVDQEKSQLDVDRYTQLARDKAISDEALVSAAQANLAAKAQVDRDQANVESAKAAIVEAKAMIEEAKAGQKTAQLNLSLTRILSPIDGVAGLAQAQAGDWVSPTGVSLTTVSTIDPIKAIFTVSETDYLHYMENKRSESQKHAGERDAELDLALADGSIYPFKGKYSFADRQANSQTGDIKLAGLFPNPGNLLRPGQSGRVRAITEMKKNAMLAPQRAVIQVQGNYLIAVVAADNIVRMQAVKVGERIGAMWVINEGLNAGDRVVVEGAQKAGANEAVNPKPLDTP